jgi:hypothetical protein
MVFHWCRSLDEVKESLQESRNPQGIHGLNGVGKVVKLDGQVSTHLAQILNRPTCWRSAELTVGAVNVSPSFKQ